MTCREGDVKLNTTRVIIISCLLTATAGQAQVWQQPTAAMIGAPAARQNAAAIYDPVGDRLVLVGGRSSSGDLNDTWELDLETLQWRQVTTTGDAPAPRHTHNAVYDGSAHQLLIWSGRSITAEGSRLRNDVWRLDLSTMTWHEIHAAAPLPTARYGTAAVFDVTSGELVNFAGFTDQGRFDDTWRLNPVSGIWRNVSSSRRPGERCLHTGAYDPVRERMIIFGGQRGPSALADAWSLDLKNDTWDELPTMPGGGRRFPAGSFDPVGGRFVTFGGERDGERYSDLWALRPGQGEWQNLTADGQGPPARDRAVLIHDDRRQRLVLFGGTGNDGHLADTWILPLRPPTAVESSSAVESTQTPSPASVSLATAYPNPFNGEIQLGVRVDGTTAATLWVFDLLGQRVRALGHVAPGPVTSRSWDATDDAGRAVASGVYLLRLQAGAETVYRRVLLIR